jgi:hypothetical protein
MSDKLRERPFASEERNALYNAIIECGNDYARELGKEPGDNSCYDFLEDTARASLTDALVSKLHELGYLIVKKT